MLRQNNILKSLRINSKHLAASVLLALIITSYFFLQSQAPSLNHVKKLTKKSHLNSYLIENSENPCRSDQILVVYVFTSVLSFERRNLIRSTWSSSSLFPQMKTLFVLERAPIEAINEQVKQENSIYGDIIQGHFLDSNIKENFLKTLIAWKWINSYCGNSNYVVQMSDEILLNTFSLYKYLNELDIDSNIFYCQTFKKTFSVFKYSNSGSNRTLTRTNGKICGNTFITSQVMITKMYSVSKNININWSDRVGMAVIGSSLNASYKSIHSRYSYKCYLDDSFSIFNLDCSVNKDFLEAWTRILDRNKAVSSNNYVDIPLKFY